VPRFVQASKLRRDVQDADREYDPRDYGILAEPILRNEADVVFSSRFMSGRPYRVLYFWHRVGNAFLTLMLTLPPFFIQSELESGG
jgi:hypothetical protein